MFKTLNRGLRKTSFFLWKFKSDSNLLEVVGSLFDENWYSKTYGQAFASRNDAWTHFLETGVNLGWDPHWAFDSDWYLEEYPDVRDSKENPLLHYLRIGSNEGKDPSPLFNTNQYREDYVDIGASGIQPLKHFINYGYLEGRGPFSNYWPDDVLAWKMSSSFPSGKKATFHKNLTAIVIPVYNHWSATERCIRSILQTPDAAGVDIIVINDGSTDATLENMLRYPNVNVINTPHNMGFTRACNYGFKQLHQYDFIYLLNNDTEVQDGFISNAMKVMERNKYVALVGSALHFPNGMLQECGGIIWKDGTGNNFGRDQSPGELKFRFSRPVDYCSGAGVLIKNKLLKSVDYFDDVYAPAYYEDVDLAFKFRKAGYQVWVAPNSRVIHHEGVSHGTDVSVGIKSYQEINRTTFVSKWEKELEAHSSSTSETDEITRAAMRLSELNKTAVLWADDLIPDPTKDAGSMRTARLLSLTEELGHQIIFLPVHQPYHSEKSQDLGLLVAKNISDAVEFTHAMNIEITHVWISRVTSAVQIMSDVIKEIPGAKIIFDTVDLHHLRMKRESELEGSTEKAHIAADYKNRELRIIKLSDVSLVVSQYEKEYLQDLAELEKIQVLSLVHNSTDSPPDFSSTKGLIFIGGFNHTPNVSGIKWFVSKVWPLLPVQIQSEGLTIAGSNMPKEIEDLKNEFISPVGWVADSSAEVRKHRISIAPLLVGAGVKGKVGESMAEGIPVVGTTIALEGMDATGGRDTLIADDPEMFARHISDLYSNVDLWKSIQNAGFDLINNNFSDRVALEQLRKILLPRV